jgi:CRP-like cAMP-binding protein
MTKGIQDGLRDLSPGQRTLFHALKQRFGARLGLTDADLLYIIRRTFIPPHYAAGNSILRVGDYLDHFTMLAAGRVQITCDDDHGKKVIVQMIGAGHAFGLPSLARAWEPRRFGAIAHSESLIGLLTPDALRDIIGRLDTSRRLRLLMYGWSANIGLLREKRLLRSLSLKDRIWFMLAKLSLRAPGSAGAGVLDLDLDQSEIGKLVGGTRSTVNRKLRGFGRNVLSRNEEGRYVVHQQPPFATTRDFACAVPIGARPIDDDLARKDASSRLRQHAGRMGLPPAAVQAFVHHARLVICPAGTQIALPDRSEVLSLIVSGAARVECPGATGEALPLLVAKPGWLIMGGAPAEGRVGFRAVAHVESCAAILTADGLRWVVEAMTASEFLRFLSFGWRVLSHHTWLGCQSLVTGEPERILHLLRQLAIDFPAAHDDGTIIDLPLSATDIANLVAGSKESVRRHLNALERRGQIAFVDGAIRRIVVRGLFPSPRVA